jgi:hypothetical protein
VQELSEPDGHVHQEIEYPADVRRFFLRQRGDNTLPKVAQGSRFHGARHELVANAGPIDGRRLECLLLSHTR